MHAGHIEPLMLDLIHHQTGDAEALC